MIITAVSFFSTRYYICPSPVQQYLLTPSLWIFKIFALPITRLTSYRPVRQVLLQFFDTHILLKYFFASHSTVILIFLSANFSIADISRELRHIGLDVEETRVPNENVTYCDAYPIHFVIDYSQVQPFSLVICFALFI